MSVGQNGVAVGATANIAAGESDLNRSGTYYTNSGISAGSNLTLQSGNDTNIIGANLEGADTTLTVGGDLTVASIQDTGVVEGEQWDASLSATAGAGASVSVSAGYGETTGSSAWVSEQTSVTGTNSVTINTEGHTQVDGALIANIDEDGNDAGNLSLTTGTLGYTNFEDHDKENSDYVNVGITSGDDPNTNQTESNTNWTLSGNSYSKDREQDTNATIGNGSIVVNDNPDQDLSDLNRDIDSAQVITKDEEESTTLYASSTSISALGDLTDSETRDARLEMWKNNITSVVDVEAWGQVLDTATETLDEAGEKAQVAAIVISEEEGTERDIKTSLIDDSEYSWDEAEDILQRDDVQEVIAEGDELDYVVDIANGDAEVPEQNPNPVSMDEGVTVTDEDGNEIEIVTVNGLPEEYRADDPAGMIVDSAGDVAEALEQVDEGIVTAIEVALLASQGVKGAGQYIAEKAIEGTAIGDAYDDAISQLGQTIGDLPGETKYAKDTESHGEEKFEDRQQHFDKGGTLIAGVLVDSVGPGSVVGSISAVGKRNGGDLDGSGGEPTNSDWSFRDVNPDHPPNEDALKAMNSESMQNSIQCYGVDCGEIADKLFDSAGEKGSVLRITKENGELTTPEFKGTDDYNYHEVYTDGKYVFDPRLSKTPIPKGDYMKLLKQLNPEGIKIKKVR